MRNFFGRFAKTENELLEIPAAPEIANLCCSVLFYGHIANRTDLLREFRVTAAAGDADLIAWAYRRYGSAFPTHVFGEYAATVVDHIDKSILLTHDALGIVDIFYVDGDQELAFGTDLVTLVGYKGVGALDENYIAEFLPNIFNHGERTPYLSVRRVRQGRGMLFKNGKAREVVVHDPRSSPQLSIADSAAYEERLRELMTEAVSAAIPAEGKVWCELSGGLDSSTIVSIAARVLKADIETFSFVFSKSQRSDETAWINVVLDEYPLRSHVLDADATPPFSDIPACFHSEPNAQFLVSGLDRTRRSILDQHDVRTVITGMCGDALFLGDSPEPFYLADTLGPRAALRELTLWEKGSGLKRSRGYWFQRYMVEPRLDRLTRHRRRTPPPSWVAAEYHERWKSVGGYRRNLSGLSIGDTYFWDRIRGGALLVRKGQQPTPGGCEYRNPWLYLPLVEFMASVPWHEKLRPDQDRSLQRRALRDILPERTRLRTDKGNPTQAFLNGFSSSQQWDDLLITRPAIVERGYVDGAAWRDAVVLARHGHCPSYSAFISACALELWLRNLNLFPHF